MSLSNLRKANLSRAAKWGGDRPDMLEFSAVELGGEVGEVLNAVKKLARLRRGMAGGSDTINNIAEELADVVICADLEMVDGFPEITFPKKAG